MKKKCKWPACVCSKVECYPVDDWPEPDDWTCLVGGSFFCVDVWGPGQWRSFHIHLLIKIIFFFRWVNLARNIKINSPVSAGGQQSLSQRRKKNTFFTGKKLIRPQERLFIPSAGKLENIRNKCTPLDLQFLNIEKAASFACYFHQRPTHLFVWRYKRRFLMIGPLHWTLNDFKLNIFPFSGGWQGDAFFSWFRANDGH